MRPSCAYAVFLVAAVVVVAPLPWPCRAFSPVAQQLPGKSGCTTRAIATTTTATAHAGTESSTAKSSETAEDTQYKEPSRLPPPSPVVVVVVPTTTTTSTSISTSKPRQGLGQWLLDAALQSPVWKFVMVPVARQKIIDTAEQNGIPWMACKTWLLAQEGPWQWDDDDDDKTNSRVVVDSDRILLAAQLAQIPAWYRDSAYHAYETGHLSWEAAAEIELAGCAIGARNMPAAGAKGESLFRQQFRTALLAAGAAVPVLGAAVPAAAAAAAAAEKMTVVIDVGCGTGTSTRLLAAAYPQASVHFVGLDLSPYFCMTARRLLELAPTKSTWVCDIQNDSRIQYQWGNAADMTELFADDSVDVVNLQFVAHELPVVETLNILKEAHRVLKPAGQLWFCEMDFEAPAYAVQRANPLLFSLIRSTEPYLDDYADGQAEIWACLRETFSSVTIAAATGRHFSCVAVKGEPGDNSATWNDWRFDDAGNYRVDDTHLQVWQNKQ